MALKRLYCRRKLFSFILPWYLKYLPTYINFRSTHLNKNLNSSDATNEISYMHAADLETLRIIKEQFALIKDFLSEDEEQSLMSEIEPHVKRRRYEYDHWDNAIHGYRETEKLIWNETNEAILQKVRNIAFPQGTPQLKHVHVLDLAKNGHIKPHIDSVRFCGDTIAGLSLLSSCVMRLVKENNKEQSVDILLPRHSLYIMKGVARYQFTHEILESKASIFKGSAIPRERRVSVICRNEPRKEDCK